ncbi:hypothetical protein WR25_12031 isoform B [Diploscapter pachys]|nr:hypothetical protein WR25_12031 isoform B [Diploscapter pachys]
MNPEDDEERMHWVNNTAELRAFMLEVENLQAHPPEPRPRQSFGMLTLGVRGQKVIAFIGPSGSGKTTLIHNLALTLGYAIRQEHVLLSMASKGICLYVLRDDNMVILDICDSLESEASADPNVGGALLEIFAYISCNNLIYTVPVNEDTNTSEIRNSLALKLCALFSASELLRVLGSSKITVLFRATSPSQALETTLNQYINEFHYVHEDIDIDQEIVLLRNHTVNLQQFRYYGDVFDTLNMEKHKKEMFTFIESLKDTPTLFSFNVIMTLNDLWARVTSHGELNIALSAAANLTTAGHSQSVDNVNNFFSELNTFLATLNHQSPTIEAVVRFSKKARAQAWITAKHIRQGEASDEQRVLFMKTVNNLSAALLENADCWILLTYIAKCGFKLPLLEFPALKAVEEMIQWNNPNGNQLVLQQHMLTFLSEMINIDTTRYLPQLFMNVDQMKVGRIPVMDIVDHYEEEVEGRIEILLEDALRESNMALPYSEVFLSMLNIWLNTSGFCEKVGLNSGNATPALQNELCLRHHSILARHITARYLSVILDGTSTFQPNPTKRTSIDKELVRLWRNIADFSNAHPAYLDEILSHDTNIKVIELYVDKLIDEGIERKPEDRNDDIGAEIDLEIYAHFSQSTPTDPELIQEIGFTRLMCIRKGIVTNTIARLCTLRINPEDVKNYFEFCAWLVVNKNEQEKNMSALEFQRNLKTILSRVKELVIKRKERLRLKSSHDVLCDLQTIGSGLKFLNELFRSLNEIDWQQFWCVDNKEDIQIAPNFNLIISILSGTYQIMPPFEGEGLEPVLVRTALRRCRSEFLQLVSNVSARSNVPFKDVPATSDQEIDIELIESDKELDKIDAYNIEAKIEFK